MILICLSLGAFSLLLSALLCRSLINLGHRLGQLDQPGREQHKAHAHAVPATGGIAIFIAVALPILAALLAVQLIPPDAWPNFLAPLREHLPGLRRQMSMAAGVIACMTLLHFLGLIDDRRGLGPMLKLLGQTAVAILLAAVFNIRALQLLDNFGPLGFAASILISALWIIVIVNAVNFIDNMDGLAAGVSAIIAAIYLATTLVHGQWFVAALASLLLGALIGFLIFNFPPARLFMGDAGSIVVGLLLAVISIRTTYFDPASASETTAIPHQWYGVLMPLMVLAIPLYDFTSVTLIRLRAGRSPFVGDQNHFSHRLVRRGLSRRAAVIVIWLCTLATSLSGVMLGSLNAWQAILAAAQTASVLTLLALLERGRLPIPHDKIS